MAEEKVKGYRYAGDIDVKHVKLISQTGEIVDISSITAEVNVFQDLFEHYIQCEIVISDAVALLNSLKGDNKEIQGGFNGGEVIVVSYKTKSEELDYKNHFFGVYDLSDRKRLDDKNEIYVLNCISAEAYQTIPKKISRSYGDTKGNLISNMIKSIVNEFVYNKQIKDIHSSFKNVLQLGISKEVNIAPTNGFQRFIIPNMSVDDTIDFLAKESDCDTHVPYYIFWENSKGFNFNDLNNLVQQEPKEEYVYVSTNVRDNEDEPELAVRDYQKIIDFNVVRQTNILGNVKGGLFRQKTINLDILKKNKNEVVFNYEQEHSKFATLQKARIPGSVEGDPVVHLIQSRTGHDTCCPVFEPENHLPKRVNQFLARKTSYQRHIFNTLLEVTVPGNSEIDAGDVISLKIPNATTLEDGDGKQDKYLSGKYLVTKVRHIFGGKTGQQFTTVIECTKDTGIEL